MASTAIPFIFPAARHGDDLHGRLGAADRAAVAGAASRRAAAPRDRGRPVRRPARRARACGAAAYPSFAQVAGHALSTIFLDNLGADLERLVQVNRVVDLVSCASSLTSAASNRRTSTRSCSRPPRPRRARASLRADGCRPACADLLRGLGSTQGTGANLPSYLLFDRDFCRALLALGYADAMARATRSRRSSPAKRGLRAAISGRAVALGACSRI